MNCHLHHVRTSRTSSLLQKKGSEPSEVIGRNVISLSPEAFLFLPGDEDSRVGRNFASTSAVALQVLVLEFPPRLVPIHPYAVALIVRKVWETFSLLILYFPFPPCNIKHNFALSLSLRLRFVDVSTWKHDPFASNRESSLCSFWEAPSPSGTSGFLENPERDRERENCNKGQKGPYQNPTIISNPLSL